MSLIDMRVSTLISPAATTHDSLASLITVVDLGTTSYLEGLACQRRCHALVTSHEHPPTILTTEHLPVVTLGKHATREHFVVDEDELRARGLDVVWTDRGGQVTVHGPGQLVVYPIFPMIPPWTPRRLVHVLEETVIGVLQSHGLTTTRDREHPGVWIGERKIAAVGLRIRDRVTMHGLALNVNIDLSLFDGIVPCGLAHRSVTSLSQEGCNASIHEIRIQIVRALTDAVEKLRLQPLPGRARMPPHHRELASRAGKEH